MSESLKRLIVDCDGVIAGKEHGGSYADAPPLVYGITQVNKLYDMGYEAARVRGNNSDGWNDVWKEVEDLKGKDKYGNHYTEEQLNYWDGFIG